MIPPSAKPFKKRYDDIQKILVDAIHILEDLKDDVFSLPVDELVDIGYLLREIANSFDQLRKNYNNKRELIELILCRALVERSIAGNTDKIFRGVLASASPKVAQQPKLPKRGTEEYVALCKWLGIPDDQIAKEYVSFHFPSLTKLMTENAETGAPNPPGITGVIPKYSVIFRKRNGESNE